MFKLNILKKGLLLVFVPFIINMLCLAWLWFSVQHCSRWVENVTANSHEVLELSHCITTLNRTFILGDDYLITGFNPTKRKHMQTEAHSFLAQLHEVQHAMQNDRQLHGLTDKLTNSFQTLADQMEGLVNLSDPFAVNFEAALPVAKYGQSLNDTTALLEALGERDKAFERSLQAEEIELSKTKMMGLLGLLSTILTAIVAAYILNRDIVGRLLVLNSKARSLSGKVFDNTFVGGGDELEDLSTTLAMADMQLREGARFKRSFMHLVGNNIQKPLSLCRTDIIDLQKSDPVFANAQGKRLLTSLESSTVNCIKLIDDMLLLENFDYGALDIKPVPMRLDETISTALGLLQALIARKEIVIEQSGASGQIVADKSKILQVVVNLLSNAIKFSPQKGVIKISVNTVGRRVRLAIADNGPGIEKKLRANLFQKFYQTAAGKSAGGSGLGLAISRLIIEAHDGLIGVDSDGLSGSTFWFELPI